MGTSCAYDADQTDVPNAAPAKSAEDCGNDALAIA
jgi:hypothetical protein